MKRFFNKIFLLVVCCIATILIPYNIWLEWRIDRANMLRKETKILVLGDSHLRYGINDNDYNLFENRCADAESYILSYYKLKGIIEKNGSESIDAICLTNNFFAIRKFRDNLFLENTNYLIDNYPPIFINYQDLPSKYKVPLDFQYTLPIRMRIINANISFNQWIGGYKIVLYSHIDPSSDILAKRVNRHQYSDCNYGLDNFVSPLQINHLQIIAAYAKDLNIPLFLVNAPQHRDYNSAVPNDLKIFHAELAQELSQNYGAIYLDYHNMKLPDSCFQDYDHLNYYGAKIFTPRLLEDVTLNMQRLGKW